MGHLSESLRERETFKYAPLLVAAAVIHESRIPRPSSDLVSSPDTALTAFAQLAVLRLDVTRVLVSLFDTKYQYVVAEATRDSPLTASTRYDGPGPGLWLCGTAIPRAFGNCEHFLAAGARDPENTDLPVWVVPNLTRDPRFAGRPYCQADFFACVPIRTPLGVTIGTLSAYHDHGPAELDSASVRVMRDLSQNVMDHLETRLSRAAYGRSSRMIRGIGSFVEGKATISGWTSGTDGPFFEDAPTRGDTLDASQQETLGRSADQRALRPSLGLMHESQSAATALPVGIPPPPPTHRPGYEPSKAAAAAAAATPTDLIHSSSSSARKATQDPRQGAADCIIFSKAANMLRESIEVEGVIFLDAAVHSFGGLHDRQNSADSDSLSDSNGENNDAAAYRRSSLETQAANCRVLGYSTAEVSGTHHDSPSSSYRLTIPESMISKLLRRYPEGTIFNFDSKGSEQSGESSGEEEAERLVSPRKPAVQAGVPAKPETRGTRVFSRRNEGKAIIETFPGARSVAIVPVWDGRTQRWFAGGFVFTRDPTRVFTVEGELSYLRAFGTIAMAEVARADVMKSDRAKSDALSAVSHELRSPLHGLLLGTELLAQTDLDAFQGSMMHTVELCGRTLLDTIDHLLDYSKINNFMRSSNKTGHLPRGLRKGRAGTVEAGMTSISADVHLDLMVEEVVESLYFGHNFQRMSFAQWNKEMPSEHEDVHALERLDSMKATEITGPARNQSGEGQLPSSNVSIYFDMGSEDSWRFHTQPGAVRRIIMNVFGNSLKYTTGGFIKVSLRQDVPPKRRHEHIRNVHITITDTGKGISRDYLRDNLFHPFSQENPLAPGTGLGLSLVKQIVSALGGSIKVESKEGVGTTVSMCLPMHKSHLTPSNFVPGAEVDFVDRIEQLAGLRVRLCGFRGGQEEGRQLSTRQAGADELELMEKLCRDWLRMRVLAEYELGYLAPDLVLCTEAGLDRLSERQGRNPPPTVIICRDVLSRRKLSTVFSNGYRQGVSEFVSQPIGPRKLARTLLLCFNRWAKRQHDRSSVSPLGVDEADLDLLSGPPSDALPTSHPGHAEEPVGSGTLGARPTQNLSRNASFARSSGEHASKFLLVDDNALNLKILAAYMKRLGHAYETATNGKEAYDKYTEGLGHIRCVLMDISMPVLDGFESSRLIRALEKEQKSSPALIIALTGLASENAQTEAFASGINLFLTKPVHLKELSRILSQYDL